MGCGLLKIAFFSIFGIMASVLIVGLSWCAVNAIRWWKTPVQEIKGRLISSEVKASTQRSSTIPVVTTGGNVGIGVVITGDPEKHITVWDCGKYGKLVSDDETVFRLAEDRSTLLVKFLDGEAWIVGILEGRGGRE